MIEQIILKDLSLGDALIPAKIVGRPGFEIISSKPVDRKEWVYVGHFHPGERNEKTYHIWGLNEGGFEIGYGFENNEEEALNLAYKEALINIKSNMKSALWKGTPEIVNETSRGKESINGRQKSHMSSEEETNLTPEERLARHEEWEKEQEYCMDIASSIPVYECGLYEFQNLKKAPYDIVSLKKRSIDDSPIPSDIHLYIAMKVTEDSKYVFDENREKLYRERMVYLQNNGLSLRHQQVDALINMELIERGDTRTFVKVIPVRKSNNLLRRLGFKLFRQNG